MNAHNIQILIVDDDHCFRKVLVRRFVRRGYQVQEAANGTEALQMCQAQSFDILVSDINLPNLSGWELLEAVRVLQPDCAVILITGQVQSDWASESLVTEADGFLPKPFSLADLEQNVRRAVSARRALE